MAPENDLDAVLAVARERMPGWAFAVLKQQMRAEKTSSNPAQVSEAPVEKADAPKKRGLMIALMLPKAVGTKLAQADGEPAERMHCTLAYPGKVEDLPPDAIERATAAVQKVCSEFAPFVGMIGGVGRFNASPTSDGRDVLHATLDAPVLPVLQQAIARALDDAKMPTKREHGFDPHVTLRYQDRGRKDALPDLPTLPVIFDSVSVVAGDERVADVPLTGTRVTKALEELDKAEWSTAYVNDLPDSAFLYIEPGGEKDESGKTTPRTLRHFPVRNADGAVDLPHLRNALSRIPQSTIPAEQRERAAARGRAMLEEATKSDELEKGSPTPGDVHVPAPVLAVRERLDKLTDAGLSRPAARARVRADLCGEMPREEATELVAQAERVEKARPMSREYLEEAWALARKMLPPWAWSMIHREAMPKSGSRARSERDDIPGALDKIAMRTLGGKLSKLTDDELGEAWERLGRYHVAAARRRRDAAEILGAAGHVSAEMIRRGMECAGPLLAQVEQSRKKAVAKGLPNEVPEIGLHLHNLERESSRTKGDGAHPHLFVLPDGTEFWSEEDGEHVHLLPSADAPLIPAEPQAGGMHVHRVVLPAALAEKWGVKELLTEEDGLHAHQLQVWSSAFDGIHVHELKLPDGTSIRNLTPGQYWEGAGKPAMAELPEAPPASQLALLAEEPEEDEDEVEVRMASSAQRAQGARAKREDKLTVGEFFYMPKPMRPTVPAQPMTADAILKLFDESKEKWLPAAVQKKHDGVRVQIHKDGDAVTVYAEDGTDYTDRLPKVIEAIQGLEVEKLVLDAELERWDDTQHLPSEAVRAYLDGAGEADDTGVVANVFDVLWSSAAEGGDLHKRPLKERLDQLEELSIRQSTSDVPAAGKMLNRTPTAVASSMDELRSIVETARKAPGSEGFVAKQVGSAYPLDVATPGTWVKFQNATVLQALVIDSKPERGGVYAHTYGVLPGQNVIAATADAGGARVTPVGATFSSTRKLDPGTRLLVEAQALHLTETSKGVELSAFAPRVLGVAYDGDTDDVFTSTARARENLVLRTKRVDDRGGVDYSPMVMRKERIDVPTKGARGADVMFVGASPSDAEAARKEPFVGAAGETLNDMFLTPMGVRRSEVAMTNAVPMLLRNADGTVREPSPAEVEDWSAWLAAEVGRIKPRTLIALGRTAEAAIDTALGRRADMTLPHPAAVRRYGNSGEVTRKLKRAKDLLAERKSKGEYVAAARVQKAELDENTDGGEGARGENAAAQWDKTWQDVLPKSGKGRFVYQHHWRGLDADEAAKMTDEQLMRQGKHSVHGDLRLEGEDGQLWGWAALIGATEDNARLPHRDKLLDFDKLPPASTIALAPKLPHPAEWLEVGVERPFVTDPGEVGATSQKAAKFIALDTGSYELGVAREHAIEIFLDGKSLRGRYMLQLAPIAGRRQWLINKPEDQTPEADKRDLADLIGELKRKRQPFLIWSKPGERPQRIDVRTGRVVKSAIVPLLKERTLEDKRIVYGVVLDPYVVDAHNDWVPPEVVEDTAHGWFKGTRMISLHHKFPAEAKAVESSIVEYPSQHDYAAARLNEPHRVLRRKFGNDVVHSGSWIIGVQLTPELWAAYKRDEIAAFSIEGFGMRTPTTTKAMPPVTYVDVVEAKALTSR